MPHTIKKMSLIGLILMIFTSVFGFANSPSAYYLMGYSAIPFYIFSALLFFIPFALMMAEMGAAYRKEEGGIYSWMNNSVGPRFALEGANKRGNSSRLTQSFHFFMFEPIFSPVNALNQPI